MSKSILYEIDPRGIATITLNRPAVHNAFDDTMIASLSESLVEMGNNEHVRAVVLTGAGASFSAGADMNWMQSMTRFDEHENREDATRLAKLMAILDELPKPSIARVNGAAFGGGVGLTACCDIAIAANTAKFGLTEVRMGLIPAVISPYVVAAIGERAARRLFVTGEVITAQKACDIGLVHESVTPDDLDDAVAQVCDAILKGGPEAVPAAKQLVSEVSERKRQDNDYLLAQTSDIIAKLRVSEEGQEGLKAFLEKRSPRWRSS